MSLILSAFQVSAHALYCEMAQKSIAANFYGPAGFFRRAQTDLCVRYEVIRMFGLL